MIFKTIKFLITFLSFSFCFFACYDDEIEINNTQDSFTEQARAYFEENATDIQCVRIGKNAHNQSRNIHLSSNLIIPDWGKLKELENRYFSTVEIPLSGDVYTQSVYAKKQEDGKYKKYLYFVSTKLIIQRINPTGEFRYFIATLIGKNRKSTEELTFLRPHNFTGLIIISDLDGKYLDAYQYDNGNKQRVILAHAAGYNESETDSSIIASSFNLMNTEETSNFLRSGESGGDIGSGSFCALCGKRNCNGSCEITVTRCKGCNQLPSNCRCCNDCHQWPCRCPRCPTCGSKYCSGDHSGGEVSPNPPTDPEPNVSISLNLSASCVSLGDTYTISAQVFPEDLAYSHIEFDIKDRNGNWHGLSSQENPLTLTAIQPGEWDIRATVNYDGKTKYTTKQITISYPTIEQITSNATVRSQMDKAWQATLAAATQSTCCEFGAFILLHTNQNGTCHYTLDYIQGKPYQYNAPEIPVTYEAEESFHSIPTHGGQFIVAHFHTHPSFLNANQNSIYRRYVGPSERDRINGESFPGILYDYVGNPISATDTTRIHTNKDTQGLTLLTYTYGIKRRKL